MNSQPQAVAATPEATEPRARWKAVPVWLLILVLLLLYWAMLYFDQHSGWFSQEVYFPFHSTNEVVMYQPRREGPDLGRGREVFKNVCALCHNEDGAGKPNQAPPLAGSEWVV